MIKNTYLRGLSLVLTMAFVTMSYAQDEAGVKATVNRLFDGMRKSDTAMIRSAFAPQGVLHTVVKTKDGKVLVRSEEIENFIQSIAKPRTEVLDERIEFESIKIDGDLASVWTPYQFYFGSNFSHCGVNSFQLVKMDGTWKIQYLIDTRRKQPCN